MNGTRGPVYRIVDKYLKEHHETAVHELHVMILSAEFGLIDYQEPIPYYDRRMDRARAVELREETTGRLYEVLNAADYEEVFLMLGADYLPAFGDLQQIMFDTGAAYVIPPGGIGVKPASTQTMVTRRICHGGRGHCVAGRGD